MYWQYNGPHPRMLAVLLASDDPRTSWFFQKNGWQGAGLFWHIGLVQSYQDSPTCCVQCSLTHTTLTHLSVSLPSSIQLSIRSRLTLTTYSYRCSLSLTIEHSSSRVSRAEGEREEWVRGFSRLLASAIIHCHVHVGTLVVRAYVKQRIAFYCE